jgi:hypothetical protein
MATAIPDAHQPMNIHQIARTRRPGPRAYTVSVAPEALGAIGGGVDMIPPPSVDWAVDLLLTI